MILTSTLYFTRRNQRVPIQSVAGGEVEAVKVWPPICWNWGPGFSAFSRLSHPFL